MDKDGDLGVIEGFGEEGFLGRVLGGDGGGVCVVNRGVVGLGFGGLWGFMLFIGGFRKGFGGSGICSSHGGPGVSLRMSYALFTAKCCALLLPIPCVGRLFTVKM